MSRLAVGWCAECDRVTPRSGRNCAPCQFAYQANSKERKRELDRKRYAGTRDRVRAQRAARHAANPQIRRATHLRQKHGLTLKEFAAMIERQNGRCGICAMPPNGVGIRGFLVDHDHATGRIRGLLCVRCNSSLGGLGDNVESIKRTLSYLEATG